MSEMAGKGTPDYNNEQIISRNRLPPRAYFLPGCTHCLSGKWQFHLSETPLDPDPDHENPKLWSSIDVPGHWDLQEFGRPQYTNFNYPFPSDIPNVPSSNPTGHYRTYFEVPTTGSWHVDGGSIYRLRFEGVDSAYHLFVNGLEIGYSQGSRNAAEFDITNVIRVGEGMSNSIVVKVYKWSDGSYIEDQDMWWLSGIFRDVYLLAFPKKAHIEDLFVRTEFDDALENATLQVDLYSQVQHAMELSLHLVDADDNQAAPISIIELAPSAERLTSVLNVSLPNLWTAECPNLYKLTITLSAGEEIIQRIEQAVGFRKVAIKDGLLHVNDVPIMIRGVNRHDHHPRFGRAVPLDFIRHDLVQMKRFNINAIRTSHYPNDPRLVQIANEIGLYVVDEADLECHGMFGINLPSDNPTWREAYLDRMYQLVHRDKNNPSIIMWSLGNESWYGQNHQAMYDWSKKFDSGRPVHYCSLSDNFDASDIVSYMYLGLDALEDLATGEGDKYAKPVLLQEYLHAMGLGPGNAKEYMEMFRKHRRLQGGFVWEWANHGLSKRLDGCDQRSFYAYGGDFGDEPNDGNFVMDGLCDSEHMPGPGLIDLKMAYRPVAVSTDIDNEEIRVYVKNLYDFSSLDNFSCIWTVVSFHIDGRQTIRESRRCYLEGTGPGDMRRIGSLSRDRFDTGGNFCETWLTISIQTSAATNWAPAGHEIAHEDICVEAGEPGDLISCRKPVPYSMPPEIEEVFGKSRVMTIKSGNGMLKINQNTGLLESWTSRGEAVILDHFGPQLSFWRALTDNDKNGSGGNWRDHRLHQMTHSIRSFSRDITAENNLQIRFESYVAPPVLTWGFNTVTTYTIYNTGQILIKLQAEPKGDAPNTLPRIGLEMHLPDDRTTCQWFGLGPEQTYRDMKNAGRVGIWKKHVKDMNHMFEMPQESGNRTDTRWVKVVNERGIGLKAILRRNSPSSSMDRLAEDMNDATITGRSPPSSPLQDWQMVPAKCVPSRAGFDFNVSQYTAHDLDQAQHPHELKGAEGIVLRIDDEHHGLGSASCGPDVLDQYACRVRSFDFTVLLEPVAC